MAVEYWIAKHTPDPFRAEPRNVGVIVQANGVVAARFVAEYADAPGQVDGRKLNRFEHPDVYRQWVRFWRKSLDAQDLADVLRGNTAHFAVETGGQVSDTGNDSAATVCEFLYTMLVSDAGVGEAFFEQDAGEVEKELDLKSQLENAFINLQVLQTGDDPAQLPLVPHPIIEDGEVQGEHALHRPSFLQRNGHLFVYEVIDFTKKKQRLISDRAGWAAYMFSDVRERDDSLRGFSVVRVAENDGEHGALLEYARTMLDAESVIVNWANEQERDQFLANRRLIALGQVAAN